MISLYCFVDWVVQFEMSNKPSAYDPILTSLLYATKSQYRDIAIESFIITIDISLSDKSFNLPLPYPNLINSFLEVSHSTQFIKLFLKQLIVRGSASTDPYFSQFLTSVLKIIYNDPKAFNQTVSENIVLQLSTYIIQFQPPALALFGAISGYISDNLLNSMVFSMISGIKKIILSESLIKVEIPSTSQEKLQSFEISNSLKKPNIDFRFPKVDTFQSSPSHRNDTFPETQKIIDFIGPKSQQYLSLIADSFYSNEKLSSLLINNFLMNLKSKENRNSEILDNSENTETTENCYINNDCLNFIASVYLIHEKLKNFGVKASISNKALQCLQPLYDPYFSLYNYSKDEYDESKAVNVKYYYIFNTLRRYALELSLKETSNAFYTILTLVSNHPLLLDEMISLIMLNSDVFYMKVVKNPSIIRVFLRISYNYQAFSFIEGNNSEILQIVRSRLFQFFTFFCTQDLIEVTNFIFSDPESADLFLSFIREKNIEPFVLQTISQFASNQNARDVTNLMNAVFKLIKYYIVITEKEFEAYKNKTILLLTKLMNTVNLISAHRAKYQSEMIPEICGLMCSLSTKFDADNESQNLVRESIMFVTSMTDSFIITDYEVDCFVLILSKFKEAESDFMNSIYPNLVQLLAGESLSTISSTFIIRQPEVVKLLIRVYLATDKFQDVANLFISLCHFSPKNVQICYKNKIDVFILKTLDEKRIEGDLDESVIKLLLSIFFMISSYKTDIKTVFQYISLFTPIDKNHHVSIYQPLFLDTMNTVIDDSLKGPLKYLPLSGITVTSPKTDFPGIEHGLTFTAWLFVEHNGPDYQPSLFTLRISRALKINLSLSGTTALSLVDDTNKEVTGKMTNELPTGQWIFFAYSISLKPEGLALVHFFINLEDAGNFKIQNLIFDFTNTKVNLIVGGGNVSATSNIGKMASASFSPLLTNDQIRNIYENGICRYEPQFSFQIYDFFLSFYPHGVNSITAFIRKLIKQSSIDVIFPLLNDSLVAFPDGTPFTGQFDQTLQLFRSFLPFSIDLQKNFCEKGGPALLGYMIQSRWTSQFTYKTYVQFYQLLENIKYEDLQIQLFRYILINFDILCLIEGDFHMRILRHWEQILYPTFGYLSKIVYNIHFLLSALRSFYWYEAVESQAVLKTNRKEFNIVFCRKKIQNIIIKYIEEDGLDSDAFLTLLSHIMSCKDDRQTTDMMNFLVTLLYSYGDKFKFKFESIDFLPYLTAFFLIQNNDINILSISIIAALRSNNLISDKYVLDFIDGLILILPTDPSFPVQEMFNICYEEKKNCSALYPLCCILAMKLKGDPFNKMIQDLKVEHGWVWPCKLTICADADQKSAILNFLIITSDEQRWLGIFVFFDLLYFDRESNEEVKSILILMLCNCILKKSIEMTSSSMNIFYKLAEFFILFRNERLTNEAKKEFSYQEWNKRILKLKPDYPNYKFGLRFDSDGKWIDLELAKYIITTFLQNQNQENLNFFLLLISYVKMYSEEDINGYVSSLQMNQADKDKFIKSAGKPEIEKNFFSDYGNSYEKFFNSEFPDFITRYSNLYSKFYNYAQRREKTALYKITPDFEKIENVAISQINSFYAGHERAVKSQNMMWNSIWFHQTLHCGPWENNSNVEDQKEILNRFVRDTNSCFGLVPFKIARSFQPLIYELNAGIVQNNVVVQMPCSVIMDDDILFSSFEITNEAIMFRFQLLRSFVFNFPTITFIFVNKNMNTLQIFSAAGTNICAKFIPEDLNNAVNSLEMAKQASKMPNLAFFFKEESFEAFNSDDFRKICTKRWSMRKISNYEYILILNFINGRTFNSPDIYPIFPCLFDSKGKTRKDLGKTVFGYDRYNDNHLPLSKEMVVRFFKKFNQKEIDDSNEKPLEEIGEAVPELFAMTELTTPENAYTSRKVLESDEVTVNLHKWISLVFSSEGLKLISRENGFWPLFNGLHPSRSKSKSRGLLSKKIGAVSIIHDGEIPESALSTSICSAMIYEKSPREYVVTMIIVQNDSQFMHQQQLAIFIESTIINESRKSFMMKNVTLSLPELLSPTPPSLSPAPSSNSILSTSNTRASSFSLSLGKIGSFGSSSNSILNMSLSEPSINFRHSEIYADNFFSDSFNEYETNCSSKSVLLAEGLCQFLITSSYKSTNDDADFTSMSMICSLNISALAKNDLSSISQDENIQLFNESQQEKQKLQKKMQEKQQQKQEKQEKQNQPTSQLILKRKSINITAVASDGLFSAIGFDNAMLIVYMKWEQMFRLQLYRESITAIAISATSHIIVCTMKDSSIVICSLVSGTIIDIIDVSPRIPNKVLISPSWGFINVYCTENINKCTKDFLHLYNVNGKLIRATPIDFQVDFWYSWKSYGGFDFLAIADKNGSIYCCENFYINSIQKMLSTNGNIIAFHYSNESGVLSAILSNGELFMIPFAS